MKGYRHKEMLGFYCHGCKHEHAVPVEGPKAWAFNNNLEKPTLSPSLLFRWGKNADPNFIEDPEFGKDQSGLCHSFIKDGNIQYLDDCTHELKGKTVELANKY